MRVSVLIIFFHQIVFQGMFFAKNISLRRKLGMPIRGRNREANLSIVFFSLFTILSLFLGLFKAPLGTVNLVAGTTSLIAALALLAVNILVGAASLTGLRDSWRVGVLEDQQTDLIEGGIYRFFEESLFPLLFDYVRCLHGSPAEHNPAYPLDSRIRDGPCDGSEGGKISNRSARR